MAEKIQLSSLRVDLEREKRGDWVPYPLWKGVRFNVSALTLPAYETDRDMVYKRLRQEYQSGPIPREVLSVELGKLYHKHILHGWEGLDVEYSRDVAEQVLTDPAYREVVQAVETCAAKLTELDPKFVKAEEGNSSPLSAQG